MCLCRGVVAVRRLIHCVHDVGNDDPAAIEILLGECPQDHGEIGVVYDVGLRKGGFP